MKLFKFRGRNSYLGEENVNTQKKINIYGERERERDDYVVFTTDAQKSAATQFSLPMQKSAATQFSLPRQKSAAVQFSLPISR